MFLLARLKLNKDLHLHEFNYLERIKDSADMKFHPAILLFIIFLAACNNEPSDPKLRPSTQQIYCNYSISAEEGRPYVTCKFEFSQSKQSIRTLLLDSGAKVELDGEEILPDSSRYSGAYYEKSLPLEEFTGKHQVRFTGSDGEVFVEDFGFQPFHLAQNLDSLVRRKPFDLVLNQPPPDEQELQLILVDTSFNSPDVNEPVWAKDGRIRVTEDMLRRLANGPIILELHMEKASPLKQPTKAGGRLTIYYSLKREFELVN